MGGEDAPLDPADVAEKLANLIEHHTTRLPNATFVDNEGNVMPL